MSGIVRRSPSTIAVAPTPITGTKSDPSAAVVAGNRPTIDHRGPDFAELGLEVLEGLQHVFKTSGPVVVYPASGTGAWEAAIV